MEKPDNERRNGREKRRRGKEQSKLFTELCKETAAEAKGREKSLNTWSQDMTFKTMNPIYCGTRSLQIK